MNMNTVLELSTPDLTDDFAAGTPFTQRSRDDPSYPTVKFELSHHCKNMLYFAAGKAVRKYLEKYPCDECQKIMLRVG